MQSHLPCLYCALTRQSTCIPLHLYPLTQSRFPNSFTLHILLTLLWTSNYSPCSHTTSPRHRPLLIIAVFSHIPLICAVIIYCTMQGACARPSTRNHTNNPKSISSITFYIKTARNNWPRVSPACRVLQTARLRDCTHRNRRRCARSRLVTGHSKTSFFHPDHPDLPVSRPSRNRLDPYKAQASPAISRLARVPVQVSSRILALYSFPSQGIIRGHGLHTPHRYGHYPCIQYLLNPLP